MHYELILCIYNILPSYGGCPLSSSGHHHEASPLVGLEKKLEETPARTLVFVLLERLGSELSARRRLCVCCRRRWAYQWPLLVMLRPPAMTEGWRSAHSFIPSIIIITADILVVIIWRRRADIPPNHHGQHSVHRPSASINRFV